MNGVDRDPGYLKRHTRGDDQTVVLKSLVTDQEVHALGSARIAMGAYRQSPAHRVADSATRQLLGGDVQGFPDGGATLHPGRPADPHQAGANDSSGPLAGEPCSARCSCAHPATSGPDWGLLIRPARLFYRSMSARSLNMPVPDDLYDELRVEADRSSETIPALVQRAIRAWLLKRTYERMQASFMRRSTTSGAPASQEQPSSWEQWMAFCRDFPAADNLADYRELLEDRR